MSRPRWIPSFAGLLLIVLFAFGAAHGRTPDELGFVVVLEDEVPVESVSALSRQIVEGAGAAAPSLRLRKRGPRTEVVFHRALKGFSIRIDATDRAGIDALKNHPDVAFVAEDRKLELHGQLFQPGMERIRVRGHRLTGINDARDIDIDADIAILDTGIDGSHPDLNVFRSVSFLAGDATPIDPHGHGTHVAGIAAAIDDGTGVHGVAPGARLWALRIADASGLALTSDILSGLDYVVAHAAEIDVINMSLGGSGLGDDGQCGTVVGDPLHQAICAVVDVGVVVVVSAGNYAPYGRDASLVSPACYDEVITVSAVIETDGLGPGAGQGTVSFFGDDNTFARTFSNYGWDVDIAAPGADVISTWPGGGYSTETGTSMAAPHVTGAAAVWIAGNRKPSNRSEVLEVRDELIRMAFPQFGPDDGFSGDKETYAEPLLNVAGLDPDEFAPVEARLDSDKGVYAYDEDTEAVITVELRDELGLPLPGIPANGFQAYLGGREREIEFEDLGDGSYALTVNIEQLLPGDYDFTARIRDVAGFKSFAGCRIVVQAPTPRIIIDAFSFAWPVMNQDTYFSSNPLSARLIDEKGAPVLAGPSAFDATFSAGGPGLTWSFPAPNYLTGVYSGITYGTYQTLINDVHSLPPGTHQADLTVTHQGLTDSASTTFDVAYNDPALFATLASNLSAFDFTQIIPPPPLNLRIQVTSEWQTGVSGLEFLVNDAFVVMVDGVPLPNAAFTEDLSNFGTYVATDVDIGEVPHGLHEIRVQVSDHRGLEVDSNAAAIEVIREIGPCWDPTAGDGEPDTDGDGLKDACDNCPTVSNRSQRNSLSGDVAEAGFGDACKSRPSLSVSSAAADDADFSSIQDAVTQAMATSSTVRIEVLPGSGAYSESVVIDRGQSFQIMGRDLGAGPPIVEHDGNGSSIFEFLSSGDRPIVVGNLVLHGQGPESGQIGISAGPGVSTELRDLRFERLTTGLELGAGSHDAQRIVTDNTVDSGLVIDDGVLTLSHGEFRGTADAVRISGGSARADIQNVLIVGNGFGKGIDNGSSPTATVDLRHSTVVGCAVGVSGHDAGTTVAHSILWDNHADVSRVPCSSIAWSVLEYLGCGGTVLSTDPLFADASGGDYRLDSASPLLDHGPHPGNYTGAPCTDLAGTPRLRDHDGDDLAQIDPGAYERQNETLAPLEVHGVAWTGPTTLEWEPAETATAYHVYRGVLSSLAFSAFGVCEDRLDSVLADTRMSDPTVPAPGDALYYAITAEDSFGRESTLGAGTCAERSNFEACP